MANGFVFPNQMPALRDAFPTEAIPEEHRPALEDFFRMLHENNQAVEDWLA